MGKNKIGDHQDILSSHSDFYPLYILFQWSKYVWKASLLMDKYAYLFSYFFSFLTRIFEYDKN